MSDTLPDPDHLLCMILCKDSIWYLWINFSAVFVLCSYIIREMCVVVILNREPNKIHEQQFTKATLMVQTFKWTINNIFYILSLWGLGRQIDRNRWTNSLKLHLVLPVFQSLDINERWAFLLNLSGWIPVSNGCVYTINTMKKQPWKHLFSCWAKFTLGWILT